MKKANLQHKPIYETLTMKIVIFLITLTIAILATERSLVSYMNNELTYTPDEK